MLTQLPLALTKPFTGNSDQAKAITDPSVFYISGSTSRLLMVTNIHHKQGDDLWLVFATGNVGDCPGRNLWRVARRLDFGRTVCILMPCLVSGTTLRQTRICPPFRGTGTDKLRCRLSL